jgi:hypothetical protein
MQQWHKKPLHLRKGRKTASSIEGRSRRQQLRLKSMGNGNEIFRKNIGLEFVKLAAGMSNGVTASEGLDIVEGSALSETDEEPVHVFSVRGAGNVGAPATPGVVPHRGKEKNEENLWMMVRSWTDWNKGAARNERP